MLKIDIPLSVPKSQENEYIKNFRTATCDTGRMMMFAGDQKVEHLNNDFVGEKIPKEVANPKHYFKIAEKAKIGVFASQLGLISKYGRDYPKIPYLIKINSKTNLIKKETKDPFGSSWLNIDQIINFKKNSGLNIVGVGYTIYIGSWYESEMFHQAANLIYQAHQNGLLVVLWMYPRGRNIKNEQDIHLIAGGAGIALTLGADFVKLSYPYHKNKKNTVKNFKEVTAAAGRTGVICVGGAKKDPIEFLKFIHNQIHIVGTKGNAVGRNIYQRQLDEAIRMANSISAISLFDYPVEDAYQIFLGKKKLQYKK